MTAVEGDWIVARFEEHRPRMRAVAFRMLGSAAEADDAVQEAWLRFSRSDTSAVANLGSWLTTVVSRVCLDVLKSRRTSREVPLEPAADTPGGAPDPEQEAMLADSIGVAMLVVLDTLAPAERVAFVLHDMFAMPFAEIAPILGRSTTATRQLASRARRRVQGRGQDHEADGIRHARVVAAFLAAARNHDFEALLRMLDPDVVLKPDELGVKLGASEVRGAAAVASWMAGRGGGAQPATVDGRAGAVWMPGGQLRVVFVFTSSGDRIARIDLIAVPDRMRQMHLVIAPAPSATETKESR